MASSGSSVAVEDAPEDEADDIDPEVEDFVISDYNDVIEVSSVIAQGLCGLFLMIITKKIPQERAVAIGLICASAII
jgi:hypothetical protein